MHFYVRKGLIIFFFAVPIFIVLLAIFRHATTRPVNYDLYPTVREWRGLEFNEIEDTPAFFKLVQTIPISTNPPALAISEAAYTNLFYSVFTMMWGLHQGSYDTYRLFRTPTPAKLNPKFFNEDMRSMWIKAANGLLRPGETVPSDYEEYVRLMTARMNDGRGLTNYWVGVCITNAIIYVQSATNLAPSLMEDVRKAERVGLTQQMLFFVPDRGESDILKENSNILYATITMVVSHTDPDPPFRVYMRFFWDNKYDSWVPCAYVAAYAPEVKWHMIF